MKKMNIAGKLLSAMLLGSMVVACQNEDLLGPAQDEPSSITDKNAKTSALPVKKLLEDGGSKLVYVTAGRTQGQLSHVIEPGGAFTTYYTFSDVVNGDQWITAKRKNNTSGAYASQITYHVVNGRCVKSTDITNNKSYIFEYNETGRLDRILTEGTSTKRVFQYYYDSASGHERLGKVTDSNASGSFKEITFLYGTGNGIGFGAPLQDKYFLNPEHLDLDRYLPIFGKFSDMLVRQVTVTSLPDYGQAKPYFLFNYFLNSDGLVESRWRSSYPLGQGNNTNLKTDIFNQKYGYPTGI